MVGVHGRRGHTGTSCVSLWMGLVDLWTLEGIVVGLIGGGVVGWPVAAVGWGCVRGRGQGRKCVV